MDPFLDPLFGGPLSFYPSILMISVNRGLKRGPKRGPKRGHFGGAQFGAPFWTPFLTPFWTPFLTPYFGYPIIITLYTDDYI